MKKWIVLAVVLVLVLGGGIATILGLKGKDTDDTSASTNVPTEPETVVPYILAKEKLVLTEGGRASTNANVFDAENAIIQYKSLDKNIAEVDSFGNVFAIGEGSTFVQNFCILNNVEYSYKTTIIVLPKDLALDISLFDEDDKQAIEVELGEKYILKLTTTFNLNYYELSLVASDGVKTTGIHEKTENSFSCEIYFETQDEHTIALKLTLKADCGEKTYLSNTLTFDNTEKVEDEQTKEEEKDISTEQSKDDTQDNTKTNDEENEDEEEVSQIPTDDDTKNESAEQEKTDENEQEPDDSEEEKTKDNEEDEPDNKGEEDDSKTPIETPVKEQTQAFSLSVGTNKNVEISGSTIRISNFTKPTDIALSLKILDTTKKHKLQLEILSGDNIIFDLSTSLLGLDISSIGSTTFRLSSLTDPSISQIFTIIVE